MIIPRKEIDISYADILYGMFLCLASWGQQKKATQALEGLWPNHNTLIALSVRSSFDLLLTALQLPKDSEIIMSGINIPDMKLIAENHKLKIVPLDLHMSDLSINKESLQNALTQNTKIILIAHLFGAITDLAPINEVLRLRKDILLIEDCAQSFRGFKQDEFNSHYTSVSMYSFGTIKTCTAMGGALVKIKDDDLFKKIITLQLSWNSQTNFSYFKKLLKGVLLKFLLSRIGVTIFIVICRIFNVDYDKKLIGFSRGFGKNELLTQIRKRPSKALLAMLRYRLEHFHMASFSKRANCIHLIRQFLRKPVKALGIENLTHTNWLFPVSVHNTDKVLCKLRSIGLDATNISSQLKAIASTSGRNDPKECVEYMQNVIYIPLPSYISKTLLQKVANILNDDSLETI